MKLFIKGIFFVSVMTIFASCGNRVTDLLSETVDLPSETPPGEFEVVATTPTTGYQFASTAAEFFVEFSNQPRSFTESSFVLREVGTTASVGLGSFVKVSDKLFKFTTSAPLSFSTNYEVVFGTDLKDMYGQNLNATTMTFRTSSGWVDVGTKFLSTDSMNSFGMYFGNDDKPMVLAQNSGTYVIRFLKYDAGVYNEVGGDPAGGDVAGFNTSLRVYTHPTTHEKVPYILYGLNSNSKGSVVRFNSTNQTWEAVGAKQFTAGNFVMSSSDFTMDADGHPIVSYLSSSLNKLVVQRYLNGNWEYVGPSAGIAGTADIDLSRIVLTSQGDLLLLAVESATKVGLFKKWTGSEWVDLSLSGLPPNLLNIKVDLDKQGKIVASYLTNPTGAEYKVGMARYNDSTWDVISSDVTGVTTVAVNLDFKTQANGDLCLWYRLSERMKVQCYNGYGWEFVGDDFASDERLFSASYARSSTGEHYVSYSHMRNVGGDASNDRKLRLRKLQ